jgi:predicted amidohydrolase YtcJ
VTIAELIVRGRIATLAGDEGLGWVEAIAIAAGRVVAAGRSADVEAVAGRATRRVDLSPDEAALPGLSDAHLHLAEGGLSAERIDLTASGSTTEALAQVRQAHERLPPGAWLEGHGWDADRLGGWPTAASLSSVAAGRKAAIWAHDHHALWVSDAALEAARVGNETPDPPGGLIRRDAGGSATGVLHETATRLVTGIIPPPTAEVAERGIVGLGRRLVALGVVAVHDPGALSLQAGLGPLVAGYRRLSDRGELPVRVHVSIREEQLAPAIEEGLRSGEPLGDAAGRARVGWLKLFADGTLASRTAALLEPIEPEPGALLPRGMERGMFTTPPDRLAELALQAANASIGCQIHAIGDRAVRAALDALEPTARRMPLVPRVEHVQLVHPADLARFATGGVAASVQPVHLRTDAAAARRLWGSRAEAFGYPWAALARSGALVAFGTDAPVEPIDPWPGLAIAVTRRDATWGKDAAPFGPSQALSLDQALRAACVGPAAVAAEADRGRLVVGQRADLAVVPRNALEEPVEPGGPLATARPRLVLIDGDVAFEA